MGRRGFYLVLGCLFVLNQNLAVAESSTISALLAPALFGMTERKVDLKYTEKLKLDPRVTVPVSVGGGICTGTFLSDVLLITAAHCVARWNPTGGVNIDGIPSLRAYFSDKYKGTETKNLDVAFVIFPKGTGEFLGIKTYPKLSILPAEAGTAAYFVGFGADNLPAILSHAGDDGNGIKGWGEGKITKVEEGLVETEPVRILTNNQLDPTQKKGVSSILPGDSGGAVYNEDGEIIGIVSLYATDAQGTDINFFGLKFKAIDSWDLNSYFVDITHEAAQSVVTLAEEGEANRSGESEAPPAPNGLLAALLGQPNVGPFDHVVIRTGFYEAENKTKIFVHPMYAGPIVAQVDLAELVEGKKPAIIRYQCDGVICTDRSGVHGLVIDKDVVVRVKMAYRLFSAKPKIISEIEYSRAD